jgi:hypothetical protein
MSSRAGNLSLETEAATLVHRLNGRWHGDGGMCCCPAHEDRTPSLSVRVGNTTLLFKCFAGCSGVDIVRAIRRLNLAVPVSPASLSAGHRPSRRNLAAVAASIWAGAEPISARAGGAYLWARGIERPSDQLRFHRRTPLGRGRSVQFRPAIIAAIRDHRAIVAVQRIFLGARLDEVARDMPRPKRTLGRPLTGAVRLSAASHTLGLAEGVETAESAAILLNIPVWATLGSERLSRIALPRSVRRLFLLPDRDTGGHLGVRHACDAYRLPGRTIETIWPFDSLNDWNDVLLAQWRC